MTHPLLHAKNSAKRIGGEVEEHLAIHNFLDDTKQSFPNYRHRYLRHYIEYIPMVKKALPAICPELIEKVAIQHFKEDMGGVLPKATDWLENMTLEKWMQPANEVNIQRSCEALAKADRGEPEDYLPLVAWFLESAQWHDDVRHLAMRHHGIGTFEAEIVFGTEWVNSNGRSVPTRYLAEHYLQDLYGYIPTPCKWGEAICVKRWMNRTYAVK